jgi:YjjG family noncanonical pyrimidine nucleotidase
VVLIDLDHTLLDSDASEAQSYDATLRGVGVADPAEHLDVFLEINGRMWAAVERGEMAAGDVRLARFTEFVERTGIAADPQALADTYAHGLATRGDLFDGAIETLEVVAGMARLALVTNGVSDIQRTRIDRFGLDRFFDLAVVSSEVGASKPGARFFDVVFEGLGIGPTPDVLMVGDSLTSDMRGGIDYGLATCWFNRNGATTELPITYQITRLEELPPIVAGG